MKKSDIIGMLILNLIAAVLVVGGGLLGHIPHYVPLFLLLSANTIAYWILWKEIKKQ